MSCRILAAPRSSIFTAGACLLWIAFSFGNGSLAAQAAAPKRDGVSAPARSSAAAEPTKGPVRIETIAYDSWTVSCRDTADGKSKKVCSAMLPMVAQQQNQRISLGAWIIARSPEGALVLVVQTPQIDIGVLIAKGVELTLGNGKPHHINYVNCNPQRCESLMPLDERAIKESIAANNGPAVVKFWKTDGAEFTINIQSIKGIDKAIATVRS